MVCAALAAALTMVSGMREADACGGCFTPPISQTREATQVTGHRMLLSLSNEATTLYDQIEYAGSPESFAWVLPIKGVVQVGLSSDLLFSVLDQVSSLTIRSPTIDCPSWPSCSNSTAWAATSATSTSAGGYDEEEDPVEVLAQATVGPYETVQLASTDPNALTDWLSSHGYNVPSDVQPLIDAYVAGGFNFLAMKLVPGIGVDAMRPVRITTPGASPVLPLRMVAAGTGAVTTVTLWVVAEGRYQPANFPWFVIEASEIVWDWDTQSSNYKSVRQSKYDASSGLGWQIETAAALNKDIIESQVTSSASLDPVSSGYDSTNAEAEAIADMTALFGSLSSSSIWLTRMRAELARAAFSQDLSLEAADTQSALPSVLDVTKTWGEPPSCPSPPNCPDDYRRRDRESSCAASPTFDLGFGVPFFVGCYLLFRWRWRRRGQ